MKCLFLGFFRVLELIVNTLHTLNDDFNVDKIICLGLQEQQEILSSQATFASAFHLERGAASESRLSFQAVRRNVKVSSFSYAQRRVKINQKAMSHEKSKMKIVQLEINQIFRLNH